MAAAFSHHRGARVTISSNFLSGLLEMDAIVLHCDERYRPCGWMAPLARTVDLKTFQNQTIPCPCSCRCDKAQIYSEFGILNFRWSLLTSAATSFARRTWSWRSSKPRYGRWRRGVDALVAECIRIPYFPSFASYNSFTNL
jgi:hypothetical protein